MIYKFKFLRFFIALIFFCLLIPGTLNAAILLSGGLALETSSFSEKVSKENLAAGLRKNESIDKLSGGMWGGLDLGFEPASFGVHMSSELYFLGTAESALYGPLDMSELFLRTQLKYNTPVALPFKWAKSKVNFILSGINPWLGMGPILLKGIVKNIQKTSNPYETVPDIMDFGIAFTLGFNINFWKKLGHSSKFLKKMMAKTYITFDVSYLRILTPDDENTAADNSSKTSRSDFIFRLGSALSFDFTKKKLKNEQLK